MFQTIPPAMMARMQYLEQVDAQDRQDGTPQVDRLRQIPPVTGRFLALLAASVPQGEIIEIGTSAGYSTMWLTLACKISGRPITTFEVLENKIALAQETFRSAGIENCVRLVPGDAREFLPEIKPVAFCFLDADKSIYQDCYDLVVPNLVSGGLFLADNVVSHATELETFLEGAATDERVDAVVVPIGKGLLLCRKV
jgi:predicted O-methyltransferase YrrM